jgi:hypothetical protein
MREKPPMETLMAHLRQRLQQGNAAYLDLIKFAYFAKGCHVINIGQADAIVQHLRAQSALPTVPWNMAYEPDMRSAAQEGESKARTPGACDYFNDNPDAVNRLRDTASAYGIPYLPGNR